MQTLVANKYIFTAIVLIALLLYFAIALLYWSTRRRDPAPAVNPLPASIPSEEEEEDDPASIAKKIAGNLDKLLAEKQPGAISKEALLKKLLRSERFKG
jgi:hypothetical protein